MFLTTHAAAGIAISQHVHDPLAVFALSFASHFVLDFIPHGDQNLYGDYQTHGPHRFRRAVIVNSLDVILLIALVGWVAGRPLDSSSHLMIIGILGGILPDFLSHFFPILHERLSWLSLMRLLYTLTKPTGLRYFVRAQNWLHRVFHHEILHRDVSFPVGLTIQIGLTVLFLSSAR